MNHLTSFAYSIDFLLMWLAFACYTRNGKGEFLLSKIKECYGILMEFLHVKRGVCVCKTQILR